MQHQRWQNSNAQCCSRILFQSLHQQHKRIVSFNLQIELWSECYYPALMMMRLGLWKFNNMPKSGKGWGPEFQLRRADLQACPLKDCTLTSPELERKRRRPYTHPYSTLLATESSLSAAGRRKKSPSSLRHTRPSRFSSCAHPMPRPYKNKLLLVSRDTGIN